MEGTVRLNRLQSDDRRPLTLTWNEWKWPLLFMLCMSALGLKFPLAYLFMPVILINRYRNDRYDFIIMFTIFCGEYALTANDTFGLTAYYAAFLLSVAGIIVYKKQLIAKRIVKAWFVYVACILTFAMLSEERLVVQLGPILKYLAIIYFLVPMMAFSGHEFDIRVFFRRFMPYCLLICIWYILDGFVVNGWVFVPNSYIEGGYKSTFFLRLSTRLHISRVNTLLVFIFWYWLCIRLRNIINLMSGSGFSCLVLWERAGHLPLSQV